MNSSQLSQLNVDYALCESLMAAMCAARTEHIQSTPRHVLWPQSGLILSTPSAPEGTSNPFMGFDRQSVLMHSSNDSQDTMRGSAYNFIITDDIAEETTMNENSNKHMKIEGSDDTAWMRMPPVRCQIPEFNGLPQRDTFYAEGDFWVPIVELQSVAVPAYVDSNAAKLAVTRRMQHYMGGGWDAWYGSLPHWHADRYLDNLTVVVDVTTPDPFNAAIDQLSGSIGKDLELRDRFDPMNIDVLAGELEIATGWKLHKQARALYLKHAQDAAQYTQGDWDAYDKRNCLCMLVKLHGMCVNRFAIPIGLGFEKGNPMIILAEPVCKDGHRVDSFRCKSMRLGKWFQSIWGSSMDWRSLVEDMKVLNRPAQFHLCKTEQEWFDAYAAGPRSCMTGFEFDDSPVRVYASTSHGLPDNGLRLFIQYTGELFGAGFEVQARAIVHEPSKGYVRAYGGAADAILRAHGYHEDATCLDGCILARIPRRSDEDSVLMPYLDGCRDDVDECVIDGVDCFRITGSGDYNATDPAGYIYVGSGQCVECAGCGVRHHIAYVYSTVDGRVCECCVDDYAIPMGHTERYPLHALQFSNHYGEYLHEDDIVECDIDGLLHTDWVYIVEAQGHTVCDFYAEGGPDGDYILTEEAADILNEPYLGGEQEEEAA